MSARRTVGRGHCFVRKYEIRKKYSKSERKAERCEQLRAHSEKFQTSEEEDEEAWFSKLFRLFNQDPIENFFGQIRQHGARNTKPTTAAFKDYFKSLLVNSVVQNNVRGTNCEDSLSSGFLVNIQGLMNQVPRNLSSPKVWDLPALPNDFDSQKPLTDSATEFKNDIFEKKC